MGKVKLTKNELKQQRDALTRFGRYLPMLQLKKQQIQAEIAGINHAIAEIDSDIEVFAREIDTWIAVFGDDFDLSRIIQIEGFDVEQANVAGIEIPVYKGLRFQVNAYDVMVTPLWVDRGLEVVRQRAELESRRQVFQEQREILKNELRIVTQRVNLFEKIKIPEVRDNIRIIKTFLSDGFTAEVVRGKIAKKKLSVQAAPGLE